MSWINTACMHGHLKKVSTYSLLIFLFSIMNFCHTICEYMAKLTASSFKTTVLGVCSYWVIVGCILSNSL